MNITDIEKKYAGEWVLIENPRHSRQTGQIISGQVIAHSADRDEVFGVGLASRPKRFAMLCFKEPEPGMVLVL